MIGQLLGGGAAPFSASLALGALTLMGALRIGGRLGLTVRPRLFGRSERAITYLGGPAVATAAICAFALTSSISGALTTIVAAGLAMALLGFADDYLSARDGIPPGIRLLCEGVVAYLAWANGVQALGAGPRWLDAALTVTFLVGATNSLNLIDNMDGVAGLTASIAAFGIGTFALVSGDLAAGSYAFAICGACLAFLKLNIVRARVYLGDAGSLFLGFTLGASALQLRGALPGSGSFLAAVVLMAVPFTDTLTRQISRWARGGSLFDISGGTDHLSHYLVGKGMVSYEAAVCHAAFGLIATGAALWAVLDATLKPLLASLALFASIGLGVAFAGRREVAGPAPSLHAERIGPPAPALESGSKIAT